jgi:hypothetical protein
MKESTYNKGTHIKGELRDLISRYKSGAKSRLWIVQEREKNVFYCFHQGKLNKGNWVIDFNTKNSTQKTPQVRKMEQELTQEQKDMETFKRDGKLMIDCEPTWEAILRLALGSPNPEIFEKELRPAIQIADIVRQAQKKGKLGVLFTFKDTKGDTKVVELER